MQIVRIFRKRKVCDKEVETQLSDYLMDYPNYSVVRTEFHRDGGQSCGETLIATMELNEPKGNGVVEVVRCKDCIHRDPEDKKCDGVFCAKNGLFPMDDNDYCSYGDRKECDEK